MGNWISFRLKGEKAREGAIDRQLEVDPKMFRKECKILLLGSARSGKSTIVKQTKIVYQGGFNDEELMVYQPIIYRNTLDGARAIVFTMRKMGLDCVNPNNRLNVERILDYRIERSPTFVFSPDVAEAIDQLWQDSMIPVLMDRSSAFYLTDGAVYFFTNIRRISSLTYWPTEEDVLRAYAMSTGISETIFMVGQLQIHMFDIGMQRSKRLNWIHCFEGITSIIFCTALSEYDQVLPQDKNQARAPTSLTVRSVFLIHEIQNWMDESLILFEIVINSGWFSGTSIILFLNKIDIFKAKLPKVPLERYFPEYSGGADVNKAAKHILWKFTQRNRARLSVYHHVTQAIDTTNIRSTLTSMKETILQNAMKDPRVL